MASPKKYPIKQEAGDWTACRLLVKSLPGFKCESPVTNSEIADKFIRAVWDKGLLSMQEQMTAFFISVERQTVDYHAVFVGTADRKYGNPGYMVTFAIHTLACSVILAHNRPDGGLVPSQRDLMLTKQIRDALSLIEVTLLDHLIIGDKRYLSMWDEGFI